MKRLSTLRQQMIVWALILGIWALLLVAFAGQLVFTTALPWRDALLLSLRDWLPWAVLGPITAWLAFKFPIEKNRLYLSVPVHVVGCMLMVLGCELLVRQLPFAPAPPGRPRLGLGRAEAPPPEVAPPGPRPGMGPGLGLGPGPGGGLGTGRGPRGQGPGPGSGGPWREPLSPENAPNPPRPEHRPFLTGALVMRGRFNLPVYWIIVSIVHAIMYYRRLRERELSARKLEAQLTDAKLQALRMQLHPHFLFNTLNAISTLVHKNPDAADEMIGNLSELLRATLDTQEQEISLARELEFLDRYLEIQKTRFGSRMQIQKEVETTALKCLVPTLILQPLAENAVRHGLEPKTGHTLIRIVAKTVQDMLLITVEDTGAGSSGKTGTSSGIGLANTRARLEELYGAHARLKLISPPEGFKVELELPYHENARNYRG